MAEQDSLSRLQQLLRELKRRKIFRVAIVYGGVAFIILQLASMLEPAFNLPSWTTSIIFIMLAVGFVIAMIAAWAFEITPDGVVRITGPEEAERNQLPHQGKPFTGYAAIVTLLVIIAGMVFYSLVFSGDSNENPEPSEAVETAGFIPPLGDKSIAVLPFTYLSNQDSSDYFSLGMTDELLSRLAQIGELSVIGRTSVMQYQNTQKTLQEIGRELGVATLLEGSVQLVGNRVRIQAQLINARNGTHMWANSYDRQVKDILSLQSEVTTQIARELQANLLPRVQAQLANTRQVDEFTYSLYLRAQHQRSQRDRASLTQAIELYWEAITRDSTFAPAYGGLAAAGILYYFGSGLGPPSELRDEILSGDLLYYSNRALALDSTIIDAYLARALGSNLDEAYDNFIKGLEINPNHSELIREFGWHLIRRNNPDSALVQMQRAVELDPLDWHSHHSLGYALHLNRQYDQAIRELQTSLDMNSLFTVTTTYLTLAIAKRSQQLVQQGLDEQANQLLDQMQFLRLTNDYTVDSQFINLIKYAIRGEDIQALDLLDRLDLPGQYILYVNLLLGRIDESLNLIEEGYKPGSVNTPDPIFDPVREEPRFINYYDL